MRWLVRFGYLGLFLSGCSFSRSDGALPGDGGDPIPDGTNPVCASYSTQVDTCKLMPSGDLLLSGTLRFDTDTGELFAISVGGNTPVIVSTATLQTPSGEVQAIVAANVTLAPGAALRAEGDRPLAMFATGTLTISPQALLDVGQGGAGARSGCGNTPTAGMDRNGGGGGGGGGGFGAAGGAGGVGNDDGDAGLGGAGGATTLPLGALGGCAGSAGGSDNNDPGGNGGVGGGAVYLAAGERILVETTAIVDANGAGGQGGRQHGVFFGDAGGGGGGSGGMIFLESPSIAVHGILAANGGGGGEGSGGMASGNGGVAGIRGGGRAPGGNGRSSGGSDGGLGGAGEPTKAGDPVLGGASGGGGGGGGGTGVVWIIAGEQTLDGTVSPPGT